MKKVSKMAQQMGTAKDKPAITVGLDLGDRYSHYCWLNAEGEVVEEGRIQSTEIAFRRHFEGEPRQRVALEWRDLRFTSDSITLCARLAKVTSVSFSQTRWSSLTAVEGPAVFFRLNNSWVRLRRLLRM